MSRSLRGLLFAIGIALLCAYIWYFAISKPTNTWTSNELNILRSLWIDNLPPVPLDLSNAVANNPQAAQLGYQLFFDPRLSANGQIACATCHQPEQFFTDGKTIAEGVKQGLRNSMSVIASAYSPWQFWDGRKDSLWSQALAPLENSLEHAGSRMLYVHFIAEDENYRAQYEKLFGPLPDLSDSTRFPSAAGPVDNKVWRNMWHLMSRDDRDSVSEVFANIGKSIAAYEHLLLPGPSRFDSYVEAVINSNSTAMQTLNRDEIRGLKLFISKAQCINCHNGPLFTNHEFHNTGILSPANQTPSMGRTSGVRAVRADPFNCMGPFSDTQSKNCAELRFTRTGDELIGTHKVPSLRNVAETSPYMHAGQLATLTEVIDHYNRAPTAMIGHNEIKPLNLNMLEVQQLEAFLHSLTAPLATDPKWLVKPQYK